MRHNHPIAASPHRLIEPIEAGSGSPRDQTLIEWVDTVAGGDPVDDAARARVLAQWTNHEVVELTAVVGTTLMLNRFATALALPTSSDVLTRLSQEGLL